MHPRLTTFDRSFDGDLNDRDDTCGGSLDERTQPLRENRDEGRDHDHQARDARDSNPAPAVSTATGSEEQPHQAAQADHKCPDQKEHRWRTCQQHDQAGEPGGKSGRYQSKVEGAQVIHRALREVSHDDLYPDEGTQIGHQGRPDPRHLPQDVDVGERPIGIAPRDDAPREHRPYSWE